MRTKLLSPGVYELEYTTINRVEFNHHSVMWFACGTGKPVVPPCDNAKEVFRRLVLDMVSEHLEIFIAYDKYRVIGNGNGDLKYIEVTNADMISEVPVSDFIEWRFQCELN